MKPLKHLAIILDGNGRWAKSRNMSRSLGHYYGGRNIFTIAKAASQMQIAELSFYTFSTENWNRPEEEVNYLMTKPIEMFEKEASKLNNINYKILFKGRKDRISKELLSIMNKIEELTKENDKMILNICFDYGSYDEIVFAANQIHGKITIEELQKHLYIQNPVDLLIRTSGEQRLSNFLLWQASYAELYFTKVHWPAFTKKHLEKAIKAYNKRNRRFGKI